MPFVIVVLPSAKSDLQSAADWYEKKKFGLGKRFSEEIIKAIDSIDNPVKEYGSAFLNLSRIFVKHFPYIIYFRKDLSRQRIIVYAILHDKQDRELILKERF